MRDSSSRASRWESKVRVSCLRLPLSSRPTSTTRRYLTEPSFSVIFLIGSIISPPLRWYRQSGCRESPGHLTEINSEHTQQFGGRHAVGTADMEHAAWKLTTPGEIVAS